MKAYIALLRGINVGGHAKVAMSDLRRLLSDLGLMQVQTLLQTGNLSFHSCLDQNLEGLLERAVADRFRLDTDILIRTSDEWSRIVTANPFPAAALADPSHLVVVALKSAPTERGVADLRSAIRGPETIHAVERQLYIVYPAGIGRSKLSMTFIEAKLGVRGTGRNWNTVLKIAQLARAQKPKF